MAGLSFGNQMGMPGSRYTQLLQSMPDTNNGTVAGGLASVLQQYMRGRMANRDMMDQRQAETALAQGMSAQPWVNPDTGVADPKQAPTGGYAGATAALQNLGPGNEYAGRLASQLMLSKAGADMENRAKRDQFMFEQGYKPPTVTPFQEGRETVQKQWNPATQSWDEVSRGAMDGPQKPPAGVQEYEFAKLQGYPGTFLDFQLAQQKAGAASTNVNVVQGEALTPGQKTLDETFAKSYAEWGPGGGFADSQRLNNQLRSVVDALAKNPGLTGPQVGLQPRNLLAVTDPQALNALESVEDVVQRNLRQVLGAQFTDEEGKRLIARAYNPTLRGDINAARLQRLLGAMEKAAAAKQKAAEYFDANGTLRGFKGSLMTMGDVEQAIDEIGNAPGTVAPPPLSPGQPRQVPSRPGFQILDVQ